MAQAEGSVTGATWTVFFVSQLKRSGDKHLLKGGALEDAVLTAITAMNEPKSCSTTLLRKFLVESHKDIKAYMLGEALQGCSPSHRLILAWVLCLLFLIALNNLKRTLKRCKMLGWMEQVTGSGLNGTYQLCYPYYPSPAILFPDKQTKESEEEDSEEEEEEEEEDSEEEDDESEDEPPPRKRSRQQKRPPSKVRHPPSAKKRRPANQRGRGRRPAPIKSLAASVKKPAKKPAPPAKKAVPPPKKSKPVPSRKSSPPAKATAAKATAAKATAAKATAAKATAAKATAAKATAAKATAAKATAAKATAAKATPAKATPVKKAAPASKPKTPVAKKMTSRAPTKSAAKKSPAPKAPPQSAVKAKPAARKSLSASNLTYGESFGKIGYTEQRGLSLERSARNWMLFNWKLNASEGMGETQAREGGTVTRSAEYVGSFPVDDCCLDEQIQRLHTQLQSLTTCKRRRSVSLKFSVKGVKMYDEDETTLLMAHALHRVSLSTARPSEAQFAFMSHNPGSLDNQLYCHLFKARHARAAQFLNLLLCRCFQLSYLEKHPESVQGKSVGALPPCPPSLLNHGFPLSVSALVSFRRAPTQGLLPGKKGSSRPAEELPSSPEEGPTPSSPTLVRKKAIRNKVLRSGAYRSFTYTPHKQRLLQDRLNSQQGKEQDKLRVPVSKTRPLSLAETEEALAEVVWTWAGISSDNSSSLLAEDVLGSFLLCSQIELPSCGSLIIRCPSGLVTYPIKNTAKGKYLLQDCHIEFDTIAAIIEHYSEFRGELECLLSCARVNHCYEWDENAGKAGSTGRRMSKNKQTEAWV
ncbi:hypothetical protein AAFF_G00096030 [Aldrovandia affinis]|uniref:SH2 domain-containing protein 5 n=1 Tax=Aldrovandia affinis TaxID=143900 RepID=A0AAD7RVP8_9TELE|nr:hypothetical protein AAFF_G00096030 [Aldrovandia affinis]